MSNRVIIRQINVKSIGSQPAFSGNRDRTSETVGIADELLNIIRADRIAEDRFCVVVAQRTIESQECIKFNPTEMGRLTGVRPVAMQSLIPFAFRRFSASTVFSESSFARSLSSVPSISKKMILIFPIKFSCIMNVILLLYHYNVIRP